MEPPSTKSRAAFRAIPLAVILISGGGYAVSDPGAEAGEPAASATATLSTDLPDSMLRSEAGDSSAESASDPEGAAGDSSPVALLPGIQADSVTWLPPLRPPPDFGPFVPEALAVDGLGRLFVLDRAAGRIARVTEEDRWTLFGVGDQGGARNPNLTDLFAQWGTDLYALDPAAAVLYQFDLDGHLRRSVPYGEGLLQSRRGFLQPADFLLNHVGELVLLDRSGAGLLLFDRTGAFFSDLAAGATGRERLRAPERVVLNRDGDFFVLDPPDGSIRRFSRQGAPRSPWTYREESDPRTGLPPLLSVIAKREVVVASADLAWLRLYRSDGEVLARWVLPPDPRAPFADLVVGANRILYLAAPRAGEVVRLRLPPRDHRPAAGGP